jgi:hypothetical protein
MRRALSLLLSVAVIAAATVTPAFACAPDAGVSGARQHDCCGDQFVSPSPIGPCCALSQPLRDRAIAQSRSVSTEDRQVVSAPATHVPSLAMTDRRWQRAHPAALSAHSRRSAPIYLQHLALLI